LRQFHFANLPMTFEKISHEPQYRECPACGKQTPAGQSVCIHCQEGSADASPAEQEKAKAEVFIQKLFVRTSPFTFLIIGINVGVFALEWMAGGMSALSADPAALSAFGAKDNALINEGHQYWRFITALFIHIGYLHILFNNYALWIIGQEIERIYGSARFVILYLATGLASTFASYYFNPESISAGASGSIFGLFGVMVAFAMRYKKELPKIMSADITRRIIPVIIINLAFGFSVGIVDNAAHIGGLLSGIALALIIPYKRIDEQKTAIHWRIIQAICLAAIFVSFAAAFLNYSGPRLSFSNVTAKPGVQIEQFFDRMNEASRLLEDSINASRRLLRSQGVRADLKPALENIDRGIRLLNSTPGPDEQARSYKQRLQGLIADQKSALEMFNQSSDKDSTRTLEKEAEIESRFQDFRKEYDPWLADFLKRHGYRIEKQKPNEK
jgi:membrane associated rhomboid family serine protease